MTTLSYERWREARKVELTGGLGEGAPEGMSDQVAGKSSSTPRGIRLADELRAGAELYSRQFGTAPWGMIATGLDKDQPNRCLTVNETFCQQAGFTSQELLGKDFLAVIHPEDQPALDELLQGMAAGTTDRIGARARLVTKDSAIAYLQLDGRAITTPGGTRYLAVYTQDITQILRTQAELTQAEGELARSRRLESLGQLTEGITHDFNNLLTVIASYSSLVHDEITVAEAAEGTSRWGPVRWDMRQIEDAADRANRLIKHLMAFARREQIELVPADVGELAKDATALLSQVIGEQIEITVAPAKDLWPVKVDAAMLRQAIVNIAINARDAMPAGGHVSITIDNVDTGDGDSLRTTWSQAEVAELAELLPGRYVRLRVADSGAGMDPVIAQRAFEPFFTTKSGDAAAGLGLSAVSRFAAKTGGRAWLASQSGQGTTITLMLPATPESAATRPDLHYPSQETSAGTIIVADDEPAIRDVAHRVLTTAGYRVLTAANGAETLTMLADPAMAADVVLADVVMPGLTAQEFLVRLNELRPDVRVLLMSGYERPDDAAGWPDATTQVITKPFSRAALLMRITQAMTAERGERAGTGPATGRPLEARPAR
jgi:PAS domain S-box-containing protein